MKEINYKIWFAGFYEAEGTISCNRVSLHQNDPRPLELAKIYWGGHLKKRIRKSPASDKICVSHDLRFKKLETREFIKDIYPFCRIPRKINNIKKNLDLFDYPPIVEKLTDYQLNEYICGFYEGDGYISLDKSANNSIIIGIDQQTVEPLNLAKEKWGGSIIKRIRKSPASDKMCTIFTWVIRRKRAEVFINDIKKYMRIPYKINQIDEALKNKGKKSDGDYKCKYCNKQFSNPPNRRRHELNTHIGGKIFNCEKCNSTFKQAYNLKLHLETLHGDSNNKIECLECGKFFSSKITLKRHQSKLHKLTVKS